MLVSILGTRMSKETDFIQKPILLIGDNPILWCFIKYYSVFNFSKFVTCSGYKSKLSRIFLNV